MKHLGLAILFLMAAMGCALAQDAKVLKGVALVIGQSKYQHITPLANPANDARDIETLLEDLGFSVTGIADRDAKKLRRDLERFTEDAEGADVAIVYYSGHGIEAGGENWLVPVDADLTSLDDVGSALVPLSGVLDELKATVPVTIFLVDACRSNPFPPGTLARKDGAAVPMSAGGLGQPRGFSLVSSDSNESLGTVIGFAAEPGQPALDGEVGANSPYAAAILRHLAALQGQEFGLVMRMVTEEVYLKTKTRQRPWLNESLRKQLFFGAPQIEAKGEEGLITGERRQLLLTIADLPDTERKQVETIAQSGGVPLDTLYGVLRAMGAKDMPKDAESLDRVLKAQAVKLKTAMAESKALDTDDPELQRLAMAADRAISEGAIKTARQFLDEAKLVVEKSRDSIEDVEAKIKAKRAANAEILLRSAEAAELDFDNLSAARDYGAAFDWVKESDKVLAAKYRTYQADALQTHGELRGDNATLNEAVDIYRAIYVVEPPLDQKTQWAKVQNNLANTLAIIGRRSTDAKTLEDAAAAYRLALGAFDKTTDAAAWAQVQNNLGSTLQALGERESGTGHLQEARRAFNAALEIRSRDKMPVEWAETKNNLGNLMITLGARKSGTATLHLAVTAFEDALKVLSKETGPRQWAQTQSNLGGAYRIMGQRESGVESLEKAVRAYRAALEIFTREKFPIDWATTQSNLANGLMALGEREEGTKSFDSAAASYRSALEELTRERSPLEWAGTVNNLGTALQSLGERKQDAKILEEAIANFRLALEERKRGKVPLDWAETQTNLGGALARLGSMKNDAAILNEAVTALEGAQAEYPRDKFPNDWAMAANNIGVTLQSIGMLETGTRSLEAALARFEDILTEFSREKNPATWAQTQKNIGVVHILMATRRKGHGDFEASIAAFELAREEFRKSGNSFAVTQIDEALKMAENMKNLLKQMEGAQ